MKQKWFKTLAVVLALAVMAAIAVSQTAQRHMRGDGMFGAGMPGGPMMGFYLHKLDLTEEQQAQVKAIMAKEKPTFQPLMLQMAQGHASVWHWAFTENRAPRNAHAALSYNASQRQRLSRNRNSRLRSGRTHRRRRHHATDALATRPSVVRNRLIEPSG